jgi:hypothetical protein
MQTMNVGRDIRGTAPRILNLSTKQGEFQATDTHHWRSTARQLLNMELVGPVWMVSQRDRSLTPAGDRTTIPRSFIPWRNYKADSCHPGSNWMHFALDVDDWWPVQLFALLESSVPCCRERRVGGGTELN